MKIQDKVKEALSHLDNANVLIEDIASELNNIDNQGICLDMVVDIMEELSSNVDSGLEKAGELLEILVEFKKSASDLIEKL